MTVGGNILPIKASFFEALDKIEETVKLNDRELAQYHTTLSLAVLLGDTLYYGHSGDSGIVALTLEGTFEKVTEQQRDEDNNVFPLFFESRWVFGQFEKKACSVLLATDGMLMRLFPLLLRDESVNLRVNEMGYLMDNQCLHIDKEGTNAVKARVENYVKDNIPHEDVGSDDITIVVLVNTSIKPGEQPASYYKEPDWAELARKRDEEYERLAYPGRSDKTKAGQGPASANTSEKNSSGKRVSPDSFPADNKTATVLQESSKADTKDAISKTSNQVEQESTVTKSRWNFWG